MPTRPMLNKDQIVNIINNMHVNVSLNVDYIYEVYQMANDAIDMLKDQSTQIEDRKSTRLNSSH